MHLPRNNMKSPAELRVVNLTTLFIIVLKAWNKESILSVKDKTNENFQRQMNLLYEQTCRNYAPAWQLRYMRYDS